jgi:hypothetical protein
MILTSILPRAKRREAEASIRNMMLAVFLLFADSVDEPGARAPQARQSTRWMPRRGRPKKDAETGETFKGSCIRAMSLENPNGATRPE